MPKKARPLDECLVISARVDKKMRIVFLRAFKNYSEYGKFLEDKKEIKRMVTTAQIQAG